LKLSVQIEGVLNQPKGINTATKARDIKETFSGTFERKVE